MMDPSIDKSEQEMPLKIAEESDLDAFLDAALEEGLKAVGASQGSLMLLNAREGVLEIMKRRGPPYDLKRKHRRFRVGEGIAGLAAKHCKPYLIGDVRQEKLFKKPLGELNFRSLLTVPIVREGRAIGVISVDSSEENKFSQEDVETLSNLAQGVANAIERLAVDTFINHSKRLKQLESLHEVGQELSSLIFESPEGLSSLLQQIAKDAERVLEADLVTLYQYYEELDRFETPPTRSGRFNRPDFMIASIHPGDAPDRIVKTGQTHYSETARSDTIMRAGEIVPASEGLPERESFVDREGVKSSAGIPLKAGDETVGVMFINHRIPHPFSEDEKHVIETFAAYAAVAIQNARQYDALRTAYDSLQTAQEQLAQTQLVKGREQAWKEFGATTAHRMGTEAADISGALYWLKQDLGPDAEADETAHYLARIEAALERIASAIRQFTEFAKPPEPLLERVDVNQLLQEAHSNVFIQGVEKVQIQMQLADDLPNLWADRDRLLYSFKEMFQNAIKAMPQSGDFSLRVVTQGIDQGERVRIEFVDTGLGVAPEYKERIFEPGFRDRPRGTGLGLAIVRQSMQEHGGQIKEIGTHGKGAHFVIVLPVVTPGEIKAGAVSEQILIVEDNAGLRHDLQKVVSQGSPHRRVITARNQFEAEKLIADITFDVVITDIKLDEADGTETGGLKVIHEVLRKDPTTPVIVVTAFSKQEIPAGKGFEKETATVEEMAKAMEAFAFIPRPHPDRNYLHIIQEQVTLALEQRRSRGTEMQVE